MAENNVSNIAHDLFIVWLDSNIEKNRDDLDTKSLMRRMARGRLLTFAGIEPCCRHILEKLVDQRVFFIVSNLFGPDAVKSVHDLPQIQTIYVYCRTRSIAEEWSKSYPKVSNIFTDKQALLHQIGSDVGGFDENTALPMSIFHLEEKQNTLQKLTEQSAKFMWYQAVLRVLQLMAKYRNSKDEMLAECRACYPTDDVEKKKINDFASKYTPTEACWWYTWDSCVYRLLNQALRTQSIEIIFKFRFFINDLHRQVEQLYQEYLAKHPNNSLTVYRGQRMMISEVEGLKDSVGGIISMNSFLSATTTRQIAEIFADTSDQRNVESPLQSVIFTIDVFNFDHETTPFAFIQNYSRCRDEEEVLFTIGAIFSVESVEKVENIWNVHLKLTKQQNRQYKDLSKYMLDKIGPDPSPSTLGWFLFRMSEFSKAELYIQVLLTQLPPDDIEVADAYNLLGLIYKDLKRLPDSIKAYEKALEIYSQRLNSNSPQVIAIHCNLGLAYLADNDDRSADYEQSRAEEKLFQLSCRNNPLLIAKTKTLKGKIQIANGRYPEALESFRIALEQKRKQLPSDHPSMASALNDLGIVKEKMG